MVSLKVERKTDPALEAADREMERLEKLKPPRLHLGQSGGGMCNRRQYYGWLWAHDRDIPAKGLRAIRDGINNEDIVAADIARTPGITLLTRDPETGRQFEVLDAGGHIAGHMDGVILGHPAAPKTPHVWECKVVNERKFKKFQSCKQMYGDKFALKNWDHVYWVQAQLYMLHGGYKRHWITVATAGARDWDATRTELDRDEAEYYAQRMVEMVECVDELPGRISDNPTAFDCKWCDARSICHEGAPVKRNCRTCRFSKPIEGPQWHCERHDKNLTAAEQMSGCDLLELRNALS